MPIKFPRTRSDPNYHIYHSTSPIFPAELQLQIISHLPVCSSVAARCSRVCRVWSLASETEGILYGNPFAELGNGHSPAVCLDRMSQLLDRLIQDKATSGRSKCALVEGFGLPFPESDEKYFIQSSSTRFNNSEYPDIGAQLFAVLPRLTNLRSITLAKSVEWDRYWDSLFYRGHCITEIVSYPKLVHVSLTVEWFDLLLRFIQKQSTVSQLEMLDIDIERDTGRMHYKRIRGFLNNPPILLPAVSSLSGNLNTICAFLPQRPIRRVACTESLIFSYEEVDWQSPRPIRGPVWFLRALLTPRKVPLQELVLDRVVVPNLWDLLREISKAGNSGGKDGLKVLEITSLVGVEEELNLLPQSRDSQENLSSVNPGSSSQLGLIPDDPSSQIQTIGEDGHPSFPALTSLSLLFSICATEDNSSLSTPKLDHQEKQFCEAIGMKGRCPKLERIVCGAEGTLWVRKVRKSWSATNPEVNSNY